MKPRKQYSEEEKNKAVAKVKEYMSSGHNISDALKLAGLKSWQWARWSKRTARKPRGNPNFLKKSTLSFIPSIPDKSNLFMVIGSYQDISALVKELR